MKPFFLFASIASLCLWSRAEPVAPNLKVAFCTGDFGMWAQDRVPMIEGAVASNSPGAPVSWEVNQSQATQVFTATAKVPLEIAPYEAVALTWTRV